MLKGSECLTPLERWSATMQYRQNSWNRTMSVSKSCLIICIGFWRDCTKCSDCDGSFSELIQRDWGNQRRTRFELNTAWNVSCLTPELTRWVSLSYFTPNKFCVTDSQTVCRSAVCPPHTFACLPICCWHEIFSCSKKMFQKTAGRNLIYHSNRVPSDTQDAVGQPLKWRAVYWKSKIELVQFVSTSIIMGKVRLWDQMCSLCVCGPFQLLHQFNKPWYERYVIGGHPHVIRVRYHFLRSVTTWRMHELVRCAWNSLFPLHFRDGFGALTNFH
jgi:hypothetical protein